MRDMKNVHQLVGSLTDRSIADRPDGSPNLSRLMGVHD